jgi:hypothetical protein
MDKEKLKIKPKVEPYEEVVILLKRTALNEKPIQRKKTGKKTILEDDEEAEEESQSKKRKSSELGPDPDSEKEQVKFFDDTAKGFDIEGLRERLKTNRLSKVTFRTALSEAPAISVEKKSMAPKLEEEEEKEKESFKRKTIKKVRIKTPLLLEEDEEPEIEVKPEPVLIVEPLKRRTVKVSNKSIKEMKRTIAELPKEKWVEIGDIERLPKQKPYVTLKVSSYYMNNRKIFVNFINSLFEPYKKEFESEENEITCDTLGKGASSGSLLLHQRLIRDYMNLYTPYRGLLLMHGLGSGKTASSIGIAEGMKSKRRVIVMTPASLRTNYIEELKKYGDPIFKKNQYWEWISKPEAFETLSTVLNLPLEYIKLKQGAWLVNIKKPSNYPDLSSEDKKNLDGQLNEMIQNKYTFINYNGLRASRLKDLTEDYTKNPFDNAVIVIDEAHNLISRIVNKIRREKEIPVNRRGEKERQPISISLKLYEYLMSAKNARIVLLSGTPLINYPNEVAIMFNILRGHIKTWEIPVDVKTSKKITTETLQKSLLGEKMLDYLEYSPSSKKLFVTRNPLGFKNKIKESSGYHGVSTQEEAEFLSDDDFERKIISHLRRLDIEVNTEGIKIHNYKALPDKFDDFILRFIDPTTKATNNIELFKRRILGLTSYFRSAQEDLLPRYEKTEEYYHVIKIPMSGYQFKVYEEARKAERQMEKTSKKKVGDFDKDGLYKDPSSTYRIFSRCFCNFVMPVPPGRPMPKQDQDVKDAQKSIQGKEEKSETAKEEKEKEKNTDKEKDETSEREGEDEPEADEVINAIADSTYPERILSSIQYIKDHASEYLTPEGLETYSPKFLHILENVQDPEYKGLHLIYSQFRTLEGIGLLALTLEENGFAQFKLVRGSSGAWDVNIPEGKPTFALYTGTESAEEKEIIRNIYNGAWEYVPTNIVKKLQKKSENNNYGEIIKVLMITSSGSEGINLKNTRYVHIMEPYWHPVRVEQVIGRARRICSHKDLPVELQTVEVFVYLMTFSEEQIKSDASIELKLKDLSKRNPKVPLTSDEALYEISTIKEELNAQLITAIKETSIDCAVYAGKSKENLQCVSFGDVNNTEFSYNPSIENEQSDATAMLNKKKITWKAQVLKIKEVEYAAQKINDTLYNVYDLTSYKNAVERGQGEPIMIGKIQKKNGKTLFSKI